MVGSHGFFLKPWRKRAGLSQKALAEATGYSQNYISMVERGEVPYNQKRLEALAPELGCQPADLLHPPEAVAVEDDDGLAKIIDWWQYISKRDREHIRRLAEGMVEHDSADSEGGSGL